MLEELVDHVIGVDPDRDRITLAAVDAKTAGELERVTFPTDSAGYDQAIEWADTHSDPDHRAWAIEGVGSYGAGLRVSLDAAAEWVIEFDRPAGAAARDGAKSDGLDAVRAAREVLGRTKLTTPRSRGAREGLRGLLIARSSAQRDRTVAINELRSLVLTCPPAMRDNLRGLTLIALVERCSRLRPPEPIDDPELYGTKTAMRALAQRISYLAKQADQLEEAMKPLIDATGPQLLDEHGIGVILAAQFILSWSHPGRCRNEAAFARLAGAAPIEATSGQNQTRHRLCRRGDRQLNSALHQVIVTRCRWHQPTKNYINRRTTEGKTPREARRCLKRYLARHIYRLLQNPPARA